MSDGEEFVDCKPGIGGYQVAVYKNNNLKMLEPLGEQVCGYVKTKLTKHQGSESKGKKRQRATATNKKSEKGKAEIGLQEVNKKIKKTKKATTSSPVAAAAVASSPAKPKRVLTEKQKEALARGREKRKAQLAAAGGGVA